MLRVALKYSLLCRKCPHFFGDFGDFAYCWTCENIENGGASSVQFWVLYCWTFEISLLLNLWDSWLTCLFTAEPLNFLYCWTFEIPYCLICLLLNLWTLFTAEPLSFFTYLFTAEPLKLSLLLNLWTLFTAEPLRFLSVDCWTFELCLLLNLWVSLLLKGSAVNR